MGEDAIDLALKHQPLTDKKSGTEHLQIFGFDAASSWENALHVYGSEQEKLNNYGSLESLSDNVYISEAQIRYGVQEEMVFTLEDMLARRTRCLFLDAKETIRIAPKVAEILANELGEDQLWQTEQINQFNQLATNYIL
jgi:glycerol-3-phosphate dehydrogenase